MTGAARTGTDASGTGARAVWRPEDVARLEEPRIAAGVSSVAVESGAWLGGVMCRAEPGSWVNQALGGVGMNGETPSEDDIAALRGFFEPHGIEPKVEVTPFVTKAFWRAMGEAGFRVKAVEALFSCVLEGWEPAIAAPAGVVVRAIDKDDEAAVERACRFGHRAFAGVEPNEGDMRTLRAMFAFEGSHGLAAEIDGELVGIGMTDVIGEVAALYFGCTHADYRRRGVQTALLLARLAHAKSLGSKVATIGGEPSQATERNALRVGFTPCYSKVALVRPGEGLQTSQ